MRRTDCVKEVLVLVVYNVYRIQFFFVCVGVYNRSIIWLWLCLYMWVWISLPDNWGNICYVHMERDGDRGSKEGRRENTTHKICCTKRQIKYETLQYETDMFKIAGVQVRVSSHFFTSWLLYQAILLWNLVMIWNVLCLIVARRVTEKMGNEWQISWGRQSAMLWVCAI